MNEISDETIPFLSSGVRINLAIGTKLFIEIEGVAIPLKSKFLGMEPNQYLIIACPTPLAPVRHKLYEGNHIILKYFYKGTVYAFQSKMIEAIYKPVKLLFLEYPKIVQHKDLRRQKRMSSYIPTKINFSDEMSQGAILDINQGGCRCHIKKIESENLQEIENECQLSLVFPFPGVEGELEVFGFIKNVMENDEGMDLGIKFDKNSAEVQDKIAQYILLVYDFI